MQSAGSVSTATSSTDGTGIGQRNIQQVQSMVRGIKPHMKRDQRNSSIVFLLVESSDGGAAFKSFGICEGDQSPHQVR